MKPKTSPPKNTTLPKPTVLAVNSLQGGYSAGCPAKNSYQCNSCFRK